MIIDIVILINIYYIGSCNLNLKVMINQIEKGLKDGIYKRKILRYSECVGISDSRFNNGEVVNCQIVSENIYDNNDNLIFNIETHTAISVKYKTIDIYKLPEWLLIFTNKDDIL